MNTKKSTRKVRIDCTVDFAVKQWMQLNLEHGDTSKIINSVFRKMMERSYSPEAQEREKLRSRLNELDNKRLEIETEMAFCQAQIQDITAKDDTSADKLNEDAARKMRSMGNPWRFKQ